MRKILITLLALLSVTAHAEVWQGRYGVSERFDFKLYNADGTLDVDEADGGTEVSLSCDEGAETTATNDFVDEGTFYSILLTAAEMRCSRITVVVAATTTEVFFIQTNGLPGVIDEGTAQAATSTTLQLRSAASFADDEIIGATCVITSASTGVGQARTITDYVSSTDTATVATWTTTPTGTITYQCFGTAASSGSISIASGCITAAAFAAGAIDAAAIAADAIGASEIATDAIGAAEIATDAITAAEIAASAIGAAEIADGGITSTEFGSGAITATAIATDAIGAAELAADAITSAEIATDSIGASELAADAITAAEVATDAIGAAELAADSIAASELAATAVAEVRDMVVEDQGNISLGCAIAALLAVDAGDVATSGGNSTFEEASGTETRVTSVVVTAGNRTTTITCPTYP